MDKLAEEEEDPKKYFDPKKYATKIVSVNDIDEADNDQNKSKPQSKEEAAELEIETIIAPVSYTHLTLPTMCVV